MSNVHDMQSYRIAEKRPDPYSDAASRARWARIEAAQEEIQRAIAATDRQLEETAREVKETARVSRESIQELSKEVKEATRVAKETSREVKETARVSRESIQELSKEVKEATRVSQDAAQMVGNMGRTQGRIAEEFFHAALRKTPRIGALEFDDVRANVTVDRKGRSAEYDLILTNGGLVAVVEVKHKLRLRDVEHIRKKLAPNFRFLFPEWRARELLLAVAYITASPGALPTAREYGYAVLSPDGQKARADVSCVRYVPPADEA